LNERDREIIYRMRRSGSRQEQIAGVLGITQGTVSKELSRNRGKRGYRAKQANNMAAQRQLLKRHRAPVIVGQLRERVDKLLRAKHSPDQISGALKLEGVNISHESIYKHIRADKNSGGSLHKSLRINGKRRYRRRCKQSRPGKIPHRIDIQHRPKIVNQRNRYGDWEVDLIEGRKGTGFLLSLYERKSGLGKLAYLSSKQSKTTAAAAIKALSGYKVKTITYDNGSEFSEHTAINKKLGSKSYFCAPYHSWEKGGVENFNGLVRQYFPKGSDFRLISAEALQRVENEINHRPRKRLGYLPPSRLEFRLKTDSVNELSKNAENIL